MKPKIKDKPKTKETDQYKEPEQYKVILLNDDYTSMEFVVEILMVIFHKSIDEASRIMLDVHKKDKGVIGVYTWDIAITKIEQVHTAAKANGFPLKCVLEPA